VEANRGAARSVRSVSSQTVLGESRSLLTGAAAPYCGVSGRLLPFTLFSKTIWGMTLVSGVLGDDCKEHCLHCLWHVTNTVYKHKRDGTQYPYQRYLVMVRSWDDVWVRGFFGRRGYPRLRTVSTGARRLDGFKRCTQGCYPATGRRHGPLCSAPIVSISILL
jgi:hypothetical protein